MTYITKPKLRHPNLPTNNLGFTHRDYEGSISTLCAGCGHDSISAALIQACFELDIEPHRVAKMSGIGCSSKTPDYLLGNSHGFNSVHGRMPSVLTGSQSRQSRSHLSGCFGRRRLGLYRAWPVRPLRASRHQHGLYLREQRRLWPDQRPVLGDRRQRVEEQNGGLNTDLPIDLVGLGLLLGATFVARSFSGDRKQLVPLLKAAISHKGSAILDVISPCVQFNNHTGSTKSFDYVREHNDAVNRLDFITPRETIHVDYEPGTTETVTQHDGSVLKLAKLHSDYDPHDRIAAMRYLQERHAAGEIVTGLLYLNPDASDIHVHLNTVHAPLNRLGETELCPGAEKLGAINASYRP